MSISNFEYKKLVITCLSPVHITDEVGTVYSYQYLYDARTQRVYFLNERMWVKFLFENNLLPACGLSFCLKTTCCRSLKN